MRHQKIHVNSQPKTLLFQLNKSKSRKEDEEMRKNETSCKYKTLAMVGCGHSEYAERLRDILNQVRGISPFGKTNLFSYEHAKLFPYILMAGAIIDTEGKRGDLIEQCFKIKIEEEQEEEFYKNLFIILSNEWRGGVY